MIAHELLTGRRLFLGTSDLDTITRVQQLRVPLPSRSRSEVPPALDAIVMRALERDPAKRWQTAADMRADGRRMVLVHAFDPVGRLRAYVLLALADLIATLAAFIADWEATRHLPHATPRVTAPVTLAAEPRRPHARARRQ